MDWTFEDETRAGATDEACNKYRIGLTLGVGGFGAVQKLMRHSDSRLFAGKFVKSPVQVQKLRMEARVLRALHHAHILKYADWFEIEDPDKTEGKKRTFLVTEFCAEGSLQARIDHNFRCIGREELLAVTLQVASALEYLHARDCLHSDVKPRNILIRSLSPVNVVLGDCADVGLVNPMATPRGTRAYWAPEIVRLGHNVGPADDIWALGITVLGLMGQWPKLVYSKGDLAEYPRRCWKHAQTLQELNRGHEIVALLGWMLTDDPARRASASECHRAATMLLAKAQKDHPMQRDDRLMITAPEDFQAITFW